MRLIEMDKALKWVLTTILLTLMLTGVLFAVISDMVNVPCNGKLKTVNIDIFSDEALNIPLISIDWGMIEPNETKYFDFWAFNSGNSPVTLTLTVSNWYPSHAETYFVNSWNYAGQVIQPDDSLGLTFSLTAGPETSQEIGIEAFSFNIIIIGQG